MAFQSVPDTSIVELRYTVGTLQIENTLYFKLPGFDQADLDALTAHLDTWWYGTLRAELTSALLLSEIYARGLRSSVDLESSNTTHAGTGGVLTGSICPLNVAFCVSFRSAFTGRSARGRNYVAALPEASVDGTSYSSGRANNLRDKYRALLPGEASDPTPWRWVIVSRFNDGAERATGVTYDVVSVINSTYLVATKRGRLGPRG